MQMIIRTVSALYMISFYILLINHRMLDCMFVERSIKLHTQHILIQFKFDTFKKLFLNIFGNN